MSRAMKTSSQHYALVLEGIGYVRDILAANSSRVSEIVSTLNAEGVLGGEDGKEWVTKINSIDEVIQELNAKFSKIADKVEEVCKTNNVQVTTTMTDDAEQAKAKLVALTGNIKDALKK